MVVIHSSTFVCASLIVMANVFIYLSSISLPVEPTVEVSDTTMLIGDIKVGAKKLFTILAINHYRYRSIIQQCYFHICTKYSCLYFFTQFSFKLCYHLLVHRYGKTRLGSFYIRRTIAFLSTCM